MSVLAIIPARGGSKGIPDKNLQKVGGVSLIGRAIQSARASLAIDEIVVTTDSTRIAEEARLHGASIIRRPSSLATDTASSEEALLHVLDEREAQGSMPDVVVFIQPTSPFIDPQDIASAIENFQSENADCVFSATPFHGFVWRPTAEGYVCGLNHDAAYRERRQDRQAEYLETGAFYIFRAVDFRRARHRFFGKIRPYLVAPGTTMEIDTQDELSSARLLAPAFPSRLAGFIPKAVIFDFDGVMTDDTVIVLEDGREAVTCSRRDGMGIARLREILPVLILSTESNPVVRARAKKLRVAAINNSSNKLAALIEWLSAQDISLRDTVFVGNDINDIDCLRNCGLGVVPADAHPDALHAADLILRSSGGRGAVREVCDMLCRIQKEDK